MQLKQGSKSETVEGSSLGKSPHHTGHQCIGESWLNHEHKHPQDHETQVSLWKDVHICAFKSASKHNEPSRIEKSQAIKAAGTTSGALSWLATASVLVIADRDAPDTYSKKELFLENVTRAGIEPATS